MKLLISDNYFKNKYGIGEFAFLPWSKTILDSLKHGNRWNYYIGGGRGAAITTQTILAMLSAAVVSRQNTKVLILSNNPDGVFGSVCLAATAIYHGGVKEGYLSREEATCTADLKTRRLFYGSSLAGGSVEVIVRRPNVESVMRTKVPVAFTPERVFVMFDDVQDVAASEVDRIRELVELKYQNIFFFTYNIPSVGVEKWLHGMAEYDCAYVTDGHTYQEVPRHWLGEAFFKEAESLLRTDKRAHDANYGSLSPRSLDLGNGGKP